MIEKWYMPLYASYVSINWNAKPYISDTFVVVYRANAIKILKNKEIYYYPNCVIVKINTNQWKKCIKLLWGIHFKFIVSVENWLK